MTLSTTQIRHEVRTCKTSFTYFCETYLKLISNTNVVPFTLNRIQWLLLDNLADNAFIKILKARKLGCTSLICAWFFWKVLFWPNERALVMAHAFESVIEIQRIFTTFYDNLPLFLQLKLKKRNESTLEFVTGSVIKVATANSESARAASYSLILASEAARYEDLGVTMASAFATTWQNCQIVVETTARGKNEFHAFWLNATAYTPVFFGWMDDPSYISDEIPTNITLVEAGYAESHGCSERQANFIIQYLRTRCAGNLSSLMQEMPANPDEAFLSTGSPFFHTYPDCNSIDTILDFGWWTHCQPSDFGVYLMGVDAASGASAGDYQAIAILDATTYEDGDSHSTLNLVATYYAHIPLREFSRLVVTTAKKWRALAVVESNTFGLTPIDALIEAGHPHIYREVAFDRIENRWTDKLGYPTYPKTRELLLSTLADMIYTKRLIIKDPRVRFEMEHFCYSTTGRPQAQHGYHDDLIFATGLAIMGVSQHTPFAAELRRTQRPHGPREIIDWEVTTGILYRNANPNDFQDNEAPEPKHLATVSQLLSYPI